MASAIYTRTIKNEGVTYLQLMEIPYAQLENGITYTQLDLGMSYTHLDRGADSGEVGRLLRGHAAHLPKAREHPS